MALYDRSRTRSFYSEIAHTDDTCYYCEEAIKEKRTKKEISLDEMNRELRSLRGKLTGTRVQKLRYVGHEFCTCQECLKKIVNEILPKTTEETEAALPEKITDDIELGNTLDETVIDKSKAKGKSKNASKES